MRIYRRPNRLQPVGPLHRAIAYQQWSSTGVDAQIHAILGGNPTELCNLAGRMFFTILGASITEKLDPEDRDIRIVRGAVNAVKAANWAAGRVDFFKESYPDLNASITCTVEVPQADADEYTRPACSFPAVYTAGAVLDKLEMEKIRTREVVATIEQRFAPL